MVCLPSNPQKGSLKNTPFRWFRVADDLVLLEELVAGFVDLLQDLQLAALLIVRLLRETNKEPRSILFGADHWPSGLNGLKQASIDDPNETRVIPGEEKKAVVLVFLGLSRILIFKNMPKPSCQEKTSFGWTLFDLGSM